jgi:hypothetical protein
MRNLDRRPQMRGEAFTRAAGLHGNRFVSSTLIAVPKFIDRGA